MLGSTGGVDEAVEAQGVARTHPRVDAKQSKNSVPRIYRKVDRTFEGVRTGGVDEAVEARGVDGADVTVCAGVGAVLLPRQHEAPILSGALEFGHPVKGCVCAGFGCGS